MGTAERRAREFKRREGEILEAAVTLIDAGDWQTVTIDDIAEKAEVSKGTVYSHFKGKDEVYTRLAFDITQRIVDEIDRIDPSLDFVTRFKRMLRIHWDVFMENRALCSLTQHCESMESSLNLGAAFAAEYKALHERLYLAQRSILEEGIASGAFPERPIHLMLASAVGAAKGAMQLAGAGVFPELNSDEYVEYLSDFILNGLSHT